MKFILYPENHSSKMRLYKEIMRDINKNSIPNNKFMLSYMISRQHERKDEVLELLIAQKSKEVHPIGF
jgi:hypothetical protein